MKNYSLKTEGNIKHEPLNIFKRKLQKEKSSFPNRFISVLKLSYKVPFFYKPPKLFFA